MPRPLPLVPRQKLPPPTTIAMSTPNSSRASLSSPASCAKTSLSRPKPDFSASASPDNFNTTRFQRGWVRGDMRL